MASTLKEDRLTNFSHFCDAKLLDFVTTEAVLSTRYTKRPTPFSLCEKYYETKGYFKDSSCYDNTEGKSYLKCLWSTRFIKKSTLDLHDSSKKKINKETFDWPSFQETWNQVNWEEYLQSKGVLLVKGYLKISSSKKYFLYFDDEKYKAIDHIDPMPNIAEFFDTQEPVNELLVKHSLRNQNKYIHSDLLFNFPHQVLTEGTSINLGDGYQGFMKLSHQAKKLYGFPYNDLSKADLKEIGELETLQGTITELENEELKLTAEREGYDTSYLEKKADIAKKLAVENLAHALWGK